jgi:hypothetical protein
MLTRTFRAIALAAATALAISAVGVTPASADRRGSAAGAAAFAAIVGTIATVIIADQQRRDWESRQAYPGPYYAPAPYAGGYRGHWNNWHRR